MLVRKRAIYCGLGKQYTARLLRVNPTQKESS